MTYRTPKVVVIESKKVRQVVGKGRIRTLTYYYAILKIGKDTIALHISKRAAMWLMRKKGYTYV